MSEHNNAGHGGFPGRSGGSRSGGNRGGAGRHTNSRRNEQGRERNRGQGSGDRQFSTTAPSRRTRAADPARLVAFEVLRAVSSEDAYANLVLPGRIREHRLNKLDAAFATELAYGTLRSQGTYDAILATCVDRPLDRLDPAVLDALRLGAHQLLGMRVAAHAALDQTVGLVRARVGAGPSGLVNAVLRKVTAHDLTEWVEQLTADVDETEALAIRYSHPAWIVRALKQALVLNGRPGSELEELLAADNLSPVVNLVALPGLGTLDDALRQGAEEGPLAPDSALFQGGDPSRLDGVRSGVVRIQDVGSQLVARALVAAPSATGTAGDREQWLDLCAGPGGKAALLGALAEEQGAVLLANEAQPHRADLVRKALDPVPTRTWDVRTGDGREVGEQYPGTFDRVLVDVPCSGLGALRRRPESRWRRQASDLGDLGPLQRQLLTSALAATRPGGVVAYVTCSPHPAETQAVVDEFLRKDPSLELINAGQVIDSVSLEPLHAGHQSMVQLWPHIHRTDAMFLALIRKSPSSASDETGN